ncbi:hypothetical protein AK812_SmicGene48970, partial [Symbiodinium microadriaticum]
SGAGIVQGEWNDWSSGTRAAVGAVEGRRAFSRSCRCGSGCGQGGQGQALGAVRDLLWLLGL